MCFRTVLGPGPNWAGNTIFWGKNRSKHDKKAAHALRERIPPMNMDSGPRRRPSRSCRAPFLGRFGPAPGPYHSGARRPIAGGKRAFQGEGGPRSWLFTVPTLVRRAKDPQQGVFFLISEVLACCLLLNVQAHPIVLIIGQTGRRTSYFRLMNNEHKRDTPSHHPLWSLQLI